MGKHCEFEASALLVAALREVSLKLDRARRNLAKWNDEKDSFEEVPDPFENNGAKWECETFQVQAYEWSEKGDSDYVEQTWNFKCGEIEVRWYKYFARSVTVNRELSADEINTLLETCLAAIEKWEAENDTD